MDASVGSRNAIALLPPPHARVRWPLGTAPGRPLLTELTEALAGVPAPRTPLGSYVEAALRTVAGRSDRKADWLTDLVEHMEAARAPTQLSNAAGTPLLERETSGSGASFSFSVPSVQILVPALRHTTACDTARVTLSGLSVDGVRAHHDQTRGHSRPSAPLPLPSHREVHHHLVRVCGRSRWATPPSSRRGASHSTHSTLPCRPRARLSQ